MFGFGDIGSMFSKGMAQYGQGLDKVQALPMNQKLMAAGQILHGGVSPGDFMGAVSRFGQPPSAAGATGPGATPVAPPPPVAPAPPPPAPQPGGGQNPMLMGLLPMLMQHFGMGGGAGGGGAPAGGMGALGMGLGGLLGKFGFGH